MSSGFPGIWFPHIYLPTPEYMSRDGWRNSEVARRSDTVRVFDALAGKLDALLAEYGYVREGDHYRVEKECRETVTFFCHFGVTCAMLAHLWNVSPFILWHSLALLPTSFTEVVTEETSERDCLFSYPSCRRYLTSQDGRRRSLFCLQVL